MNVNGSYSHDKSLHDAELIAVNIDRKNSIGRLDFRLTGAKLCVIELLGLKAFRGEDLILQNVVSRVLLSTSKDFSLDDLGYWVTWVTSLSDAPSWLSDTSKREWLESLASGELELVVFEPSAGAQIAAVCEGTKNISLL